VAAEKDLLAVGIDAGSLYTRCVILQLDDGYLRYLGHGETESAGWTKGRLTDHVAVQHCMRSAIEQAQEIARVEVDAVVLGVGGPTIDGSNTRGLYDFGRPHRVTQREITSALEGAAKIRMEGDRMLLEMLPQDFTLDGRTGYRHAVGSLCSHLDANVYLITASQREHEMLLTAAHHAFVAVEETVFEPVASAYAAIRPEERSRGVALIDIGWQSTGMVVYDGDALVLAKSLPVSADHFTRDIAMVLKVAYEDAERLKLQYGCAMRGLTGENSVVELPTQEGRAPREASRRLLNEILEERAKELFAQVRRELEQIGMEHSLLQGVVLTGGGSLLNGMWEMAERELNCPAQNGLPIGIESWPDDINHAGWAVASGLAMYSAMLKSKGDGGKRAPGLLGLVLR
jgi:cell division protein FtsA